MKQAHVISLILVIGSLILISGCASSEPEKTTFKMPDNFNTTIFEVSTPEDSDRYAMQTFKIAGEKPADLFEIWKKTQAEKEGQDKYDTIRKIYDDTSLEDEEAELEGYCNALFSNSCLQMKYTFDSQGCRKVTAECKKYNGDDLCIRYDISINDEYLDESDCVE
jgi:hypothetical protein